MKEEDIRKYASLMKELELTGLEIEMDGGKVRMERSSGIASPQVAYQVAAEAPKADKADEEEAAGEPVLKFLGIPVKCCDAILDTEDKVAAA